MQSELRDQKRLSLTAVLVIDETAGEQSLLSDPTVIHDQR